MTGSEPRSDVVARILLDGHSIAFICHRLKCNQAQVEWALRRAFDKLDKKRKARR